MIIPIITKFTILRQNEGFQGYTRISLSIIPRVGLSLFPSVYKILVSGKALAEVLHRI